MTQSTCQSNFGTVNLTGAMTMYDGSTIMNAAGARWNFAGDSSILLAAGQAAGPDINGMGVIAKTYGTGVSHIGVNLATEGVVSVQTGTLSFEGASSAFSSTINGAGAFQISAGAAVIEPGARLSVGHWTLAGGTTTLRENLGYAGAFTGKAGASLDLGGHVLQLSQSPQFAGLAVQGAGVLQAMGAVAIAGLKFGGTATLSLFGHALQSGGDVTLGDSSPAAKATIAIRAGGSWQIADASSIQRGADPASTLTLSGSALFAKTGAGVSHVSPSIYNAGLNTASAYGGIEVTAGALDLQGAVSGIGSANIVGAATLEFDSFVSSGQTVFFTGTGGVLALADLAEFHAKISGFDTVGSDDALSIANGWSFAGATETTSAATLSFTHGALHQSLTLLGDYTGGAFSAATIGGQLKITF